MLSKNYTQPLAVHTFNNGISAVDSTGFALYDLNTQQMAVGQSPQSRELIHKAQMVLQSATKNIRNMNNK